jgi:hypothetical protein
VGAPPAQDLANCAEVVRRVLAPGAARGLHRRRFDGQEPPVANEPLTSRTDRPAHQRIGRALVAHCACRTEDEPAPSIDRKRGSGQPTAAPRPAAPHRHGTPQPRFAAWLIQPPATRLVWAVGSATGNGAGRGSRRKQGPASGPATVYLHSHVADADVSGSGQCQERKLARAARRLD